MNRFNCLLGMTLAFAGQGQAQRVLYSSHTINQSGQDAAIKTIRPHWAFSNVITVIYKNGHTERIPKDSIWGYEDRHGRLYRYYKNEFYRVRKVENLVYYTILRPTGQSVANRRLFSKSYDSPLRWTKAKARRDSNYLD